MPELEHEVSPRREIEGRRYLRSQHIKGWVHLEGTNNRVKEVNDILVLLVIITVTRHIEGRCASCMFRELEVE